MGCLFCKIIAGEIPSETVYEDSTFKVIMDINPVSYGHVLVLPKKHSVDISDMDDDTAATILPVIRNVAEMLKKGLSATGINIVQNNGGDAGQLIWHAHFHVIPRRPDDGIQIGMVHNKYAEGEMKLYADRIRSAGR